MKKNNFSSEYKTTRAFISIGCFMQSGMTLASVIVGETKYWWLGVITFLLGVSIFYDLIKK